MGQRNKEWITCVCTGNVCRSPMAEKLLAHALAAESAPLKELQICSAGISAWEGQPASKNSQTAMKKVGLDLSTHKSKQLTREMLERSELVLVMTESHRQVILQHFSDLSLNILLFRELLPEPADPEIPDPFGGNLEIYEHCRDAIVEAVPSLVNHLKTLLSSED